MLLCEITDPDPRGPRGAPRGPRGARGPKLRKKMSENQKKKEIMCFYADFAKITFIKNVKYGILGPSDYARKMRAAILRKTPRSLVRDLSGGVHFCKKSWSKSSVAPAFTLIFWD